MESLKQVFNNENLYPISNNPIDIPLDIPTAPQDLMKTTLKGFEKNVYLSKKAQKPQIDETTRKKTACIDKMINGNQSAKNKAFVRTTLQKFPLSFLEDALKHGIKIQIVPINKNLTDYGVGDINGDGKVISPEWEDKNGNGKWDPGEKLTKGKWVDSNKDGKKQVDEIEGLTFDGRKWGEVGGCFDPSKKTLYIHEQRINDGDFGRQSLLHEFAHAIDDVYRNDPDLKDMWEKTIGDFYKACKDKKPGHTFTDDYSSTHEDEYFACGVSDFLYNLDSKKSLYTKNRNLYNWLYYIMQNGRNAINENTYNNSIKYGSEL